MILIGPLIHVLSWDTGTMYIRLLRTAMQLIDIKMYDFKRDNLLNVLNFQIAT